MSLANLLSAEQIIPEMQATERWSAIVELIDLLVSLGKIRPADRDPILAALKQREETMSTGIGFGIAIPHCSSDRLDEVVAAFGRSTKGIEFDAGFHREISERPLCARESCHREIRRRNFGDLSRAFVNAYRCTEHRLLACASSGFATRCFLTRGGVQLRWARRPGGLCSTAAIKPSDENVPVTSFKKA